MAKLVGEGIGDAAMMLVNACRFANRTAAAFAHPLSIAVFPLVCVLWLFVGYGVEALTLVLSVLAISTTQLVLLAQDRDTKAVHAKLDALVRGTDADDAVAGIERV